MRRHLDAEMRVVAEYESVVESLEAEILLEARYRGMEHQNGRSRGEQATKQPQADSSHFLFLHLWTLALRL
jgi:hypothetical protein